MTGKYCLYENFFKPISNYNDRYNRKVRKSLSTPSVPKKQKINVLHDFEGFNLLANYLHKNIGIYLPENEKNLALMAGRLKKILSQYHLESYQNIYSEILSGNKNLEKDFTEAMTTNTTFFFRESQHFDYLLTVLPSMLQKKELKNDFEIRIWCAACSKGAEAYSLAMELSHALENSKFKVRILATDVNSQVLDIALEGVYSAKEIENVPEHYIAKYFIKGKGSSKGFFRIKKEIRQKIMFGQFNIKTGLYLFKSRFDFIFCRNVFIYFQPSEVIHTIEKMEKTMEEGGFLFLGHSETVSKALRNLSRKAPAVYQKSSSSFSKSV